MDNEIQDSAELVHQLEGPEDLAETLKGLEEHASSSLACDQAIILERKSPQLFDGDGLIFRGTLEGLRLLQGDALVDFEGLPDSTKNALLVPLYSPAGRILGAVAFLDIPDSLAQVELERATSLATMAAMAVWKARLAGRGDRALKEMEFASEVTREFLPKTEEQHGDYEFTGLLIPAGLTGGDIYDYFEIEPGLVGFMIADAAGKGIGPCLQVSQARAYFRALAGKPDALRACIARVNNLLYADLQDDRFITAAFGILNTLTHRLHLVDAGHSLIFHARESGEPETPTCAGLPLGVFKDEKFEVTTVCFESGAVLALFTDGWVERTLPNGEEFGRERLLGYLSEMRGKEARVQLRFLYQKFELECIDQPQGDDVTAVVVTRRKSIS